MKTLPSKALRGLVQRRRAALFVAAALCLGEASATPGKYISPSWTDFAGPSYNLSDKLVGTYYFAWYDGASGLHFTRRGGYDHLSIHPEYVRPVAWKDKTSYWKRRAATVTSSVPFSFLEPEWHRGEMKEMHGANIDFALYMFGPWPDTSNYYWPRWTYTAGLENLDAGLDRMESNSEPSPRIGCLFGTLELAKARTVDNQKIDYRTDLGKQIFYEAIRDFFSRIHPKRWLRFNGSPVVYPWVETAIKDRYDATTFQYASDRFAQDFGGVRPAFVGSGRWRRNGVPLIATLNWGAARNPKRVSTSADWPTVGPGFDTRAAWRTPKVVDRGNGSLYREGWRKAIASKKSVIMVETWNEWHEGTGVAKAHRSDGGSRIYNITKQFAARHKGGN